ncbi:unnamed protein product [Peronospora destructor]|uniref:Carbohydrate-binding protein n=1 Tax=Peronospora destructor TaxID=86335 RepID=A0AAV0V6G8_9STRA|nr:unnamed protein product [Peronospora destructor]
MTPLRFLLVAALSASCVVAVEVSICQDATYIISVDATALCSGAGSESAGRSCPKKGDVAVANCLSTLASFGSGSCVAPEDAVCKLVNKDTWGCVLPSVGCNEAPIEAVVESSCETWDYSGDVSGDNSGSFDRNEDYDESWFTNTTKLRELYDCGNAPTPAPTTATPKATPAPTETSTTETPTQMTTSASSDSYETMTETKAPTPSPTADNDAETGRVLPSALTPTSTLALTSTLTPKPAANLTSVSAECSGSLSDEVDVRSKADSESADGDENNRAGNSAKVTFAVADAVISGGLSDETLAVIAGVMAFAAVIVAAIAVVYARKKLVKEDVEGDVEEEKEEKADGGDERKEDEEVEVESQASSLVAPSTPADVAGHLATTPPVAAAKAMLTVVTAEASTTVTMNSCDITSATADNASGGHADDGSADAASSQKTVTATDAC